MTWSNTGIIPSATNIMDLESYNGNLYAGDSTGKVFVYDENNDSWGATGTLSGATEIGTMCKHNGKLYAGTENNGDVFVYDKSADTWTNTGNLSGATYIWDLQSNNDILYATTYPNSDIFKYNESANTWSQIKTTIGWCIEMESYRNELYVVTSGIQIHKYNDLTDSWTYTELPGISGQGGFSIRKHNNKLYVGTILGNVYVFDETTDTWITTNLSGTGYIRCIESYNGNLYAGDEAGNIFIYNDLTDTWSTTGGLLWAIKIYDLQVYNGKLYAGTGYNGDVFVTENIISWLIKINNINQLDFETIKVLDTIAGSKKFDCEITDSDKVFDHYSNVKIYGESGDLIFTGRIEDIVPNYENNNVIISGRDYIAELIDKFVVEAYDNKLRSYIVDDLLEKHSSHISRSYIQNSPIDSEITHTFKESVWDVLVECAKDDGYKFWVDQNNNFHYVPKGYTTSALTLILGTDDIYEFNIEKNSTDIINSVTVIGSGNPQIIYTKDDITSQNYYGIIKSSQIFDNSITDTAAAVTKADNFLANNAWVLDIITFTVDGYENLNAGELIQTTLNGYDIDDLYLVIDKEHLYPDGITKIKVARYSTNLETIISNLINRLNNLERQTVITARIQKIYETQGLTDTLKIYKRTVGSSFRLGVTGHCELGKMNLRDNSGVLSLEYSGS